MIASIVRLYALWVYAVTDDPPYDDIFVSANLVETMLILDRANTQKDPFTLPDRSERSYHIRLRSSPSTTS